MCVSIVMDGSGVHVHVHMLCALSVLSLCPSGLVSVCSLPG